MHIVIVADGIDKLSEEYLTSLERVGIFSFKQINKDYRDEIVKPGHTGVEVKYSNLSFINKENMNAKKRKYGCNNVGHTFSRYMHFEDWLMGLKGEQRKGMKVDNYEIGDFLLGNTIRGKVKEHIYSYKRIPIHYCIKHRNEGKIGSHNIFFKGFCQYMNPEYAQIIDCGSIALWNSISEIIMHMEVFRDVGGACGEIEVIVTDKDEHGQPLDIIGDAVVKTQYVEYKISHYLDKAVESLFGFVSVLPGAFSLFRWDCINGAPLNKFLKGAKDDFAVDAKPPSCAHANMYLAEDRIM